MISDIRFSELTVARQQFVRHCHRIGFGKIIQLAVRDGEPVILPETEVLIDVKLDADDVPRPEQALKDFVLPAEVIRLFSKMDAIGNGVVEHVEVRAGIPRRIVFKSRVQI